LKGEALPMRKRALENLNLNIKFISELLSNKKNEALATTGKVVIDVMEKLKSKLNNDDNADKIHLVFIMCQQLRNLIGYPDEFTNKELSPSYYVELAQECDQLVQDSSKAFLDFAFTVVKQRVSIAVSTRANQFLSPIVDSFEAALAEIERINNNLLPIDKDKFPLLIRALEMIEQGIKNPPTEEEINSYKTLISSLYTDQLPPVMREFIDCMLVVGPLRVEKSSQLQKKSNVSGPLFVAANKIRDLLGNKLIEKLPANNWNLLIPLLKNVTALVENKTIEDTEKPIKNLKDAIANHHKVLADQTELAYRAFLYQVAVSGADYSDDLRDKANLVLTEVEKLKDRVSHDQLPVLNESLQTTTFWITNHPDKFPLLSSLNDLITKVNNLTDKVGKKIGHKLGIALIGLGVTLAVLGFGAACVALTIFAAPVALIPVVGFIIAKVGMTASFLLAAEAAIAIGGIPIVGGLFFKHREKDERKALVVKIKEFGKTDIERDPKPTDPEVENKIEQTEYITVSYNSSNSSGSHESDDENSNTPSSTSGVSYSS
ncbi:MAG: hypothetical protein WBE18_03150, partial [Gammaproteobacteria bacterium]